ncbi:MAG: glutamate racemase [Chloroflexota bacterium]|nr:glutamate racemase [Chloroflexota bacterium]
MEKGPEQSNLIGIFDSGVGGLSVLREIRALLPAQPLYYIGDQAHVPYGKRQSDEIRRFSFAMTRHLLAAGAKLIVVACNTASAAALKDLRRKFPDTPFVGMEPALKPATQQTHNKVVGVLATPATFQGELYNTLLEKFAQDVTVLTDTLPGLVDAIEAGQLDSPQTRAILEKAIQPMLAQGADTLVLGCTHFPFALPLIRQIAGPHVNVIDPAPAIARRTQALLQEHNLQNPAGANGAMRFATSGNLAAFQTSISNLLNMHTQPIQLSWDASGNQLTQEEG